MSDIPIIHYKSPCSLATTLAPIVFGATYDSAKNGTSIKATFLFPPRISKSCDRMPCKELEVE